VCAIEVFKETVIRIGCAGCGSSKGGVTEVVVLLSSIMTASST